jgi:hypothetical protein
MFSTHWSLSEFFLQAVASRSRDAADAKDKSHHATFTYLIKSIGAAVFWLHVRYFSSRIAFKIGTLQLVATHNYV